MKKPDKFLLGKDDKGKDRVRTSKRKQQTVQSCTINEAVLLWLVMGPGNSRDQSFVEVGRLEK